MVTLKELFRNMFLCVFWKVVFGLESSRVLKISFHPQGQLPSSRHEDRVLQLDGDGADTNWQFRAVALEEIF